VFKWRRIRGARHAALVRDMRNAYGILSKKKPQGKRLPGKHSRRWVNNIKINLEEIV
jgi:hypothetical protein